MNHISHLTDDQIERYVQQDNDLSGNGPFEAHIAECESCHSRLLEAERNRLGLRTSRMRNASRSAKCPQEDDLQAFAAGVRPPWILEHVAECDYCAPLLQEYLGAIEEDLEPDLNPEPDPSPSPFVIGEGGKTTVIDEGGKRNRIPKKIFLGFKKASERLHFLPGSAKASLAGAAGVLLACIPLVPTAWNAYSLNQAEKAITAAAPEASLMMRLNWAAHPQATFLKDPMKPPSASDSRPLALASELASNNQNSIDPRWIRFRGQVKLISGEYEDSAKLLSLATEMGLNDPDTEIDLAVAEFQRDTQHASADDREKEGPLYLSESLELLRKILKNPKLTPNQRATATFDLAMVYQRMQSWDEAVVEWEKYLQLDPASAWHDDARRGLEEARKKNHPPKPQGYRTPGFFLNHLPNPEVLDSIEDYQEIALREWLPHIDDSGGYEFLLAFRKLAEIMESRHGDPWLRDFLAVHRRGDWPALTALSEAMTRNRRGAYSAAKRSAQEAERFFGHFQSSPGELMARFEAVYADQRLLLQESCLKQAGVLRDDLAQTHYEWLRTQIALEQAVCLNFMERIKAAEEQLDAARHNAALFDFPFLNLRVQSLDATIHIYNSHNCEDSWPKAQAGLEQYWRGSSNPQRLYEFYSPLKLCLGQWHFWNAAEALQRRMIAILEKEIDPLDQNALLQGTAHRALEQILRELDEPEEAADEAKLALELLSRVEPDVALRTSIPTQLDVADLQLEHDDAEGAWKTIQEADNALAALRKAENDVEKEKNLLLQRTLLRVRGDVNLKRQMFSDAEADYQEGIVIAEGALKESKTEKQRRDTIKDTGDLYRGLAEVYIYQKQEQEALQLWSWYQGRSYAPSDAKDTGAAPTWADIEGEVLRQPLPFGQVPRLVYASARDKLLIWSFGRFGFNVTSVPIKRVELQNKIQQYLHKIGREQLSELPLPAPEAESKELFALVLQPVLNALTVTGEAAPTIAIDFDSAMNGLQTEYLMSPEGWYFGQRYPVIYSSGFIRENQLRKYPGQAPTRGLVIDALGNQDVVNRFKELVPQAKIIDDSNASPEERESLLAGSEAFMFIGHGKSGALLLANGKPLRAENFPPHSLANMQLAVLVACSSGVARGGLLDTGGLIHAFQAGGTPAVVASQWNVAADFTEQFMDSFFSNMKRGDSPAQALFEARKQLFHVKSHPYYWAAFTLSGRA